MLSPNHIQVVNNKVACNVGLKETCSLSSLYERWYDPPWVCLNENIGKNQVCADSVMFLRFYFSKSCLNWIQQTTLQCFYTPVRIWRTTEWLWLSLWELSYLSSNLLYWAIWWPHKTNAMVRLDILAEVCTITRTIFKAYVRMNDVQRTVL